MNRGLKQHTTDATAMDLMPSSQLKLGGGVARCCTRKIQIQIQVLPYSTQWPRPKPNQWDLKDPSSVTLALTGGSGAPRPTCGLGLGLGIGTGLGLLSATCHGPRYGDGNLFIISVWGE